MVAAMKHRMAVRLMEEDDLDQVMQIEESSYDFCWTRQIFVDCMRSGYCCLVLAEQDNDLVHGYAVLLLGPQEAHVLNVCIEEDFRGKGWARHVMLDLIDMSRRANCHELFLEVRPSNAIAYRLYESLGFNEVGLRPNYYKSHDGREDAIVMALNLSAYFLS